MSCAAVVQKPAFLYARSHAPIGDGLRCHKDERRGTEVAVAVRVLKHATWDPQPPSASRRIRRRRRYRDLCVGPCNDALKLCKQT